MKKRQVKFPGHIMKKDGLKNLILTILMKEAGRWKERECYPMNLGELMAELGQVRMKKKIKRCLEIECSGAP